MHVKQETHRLLPQTKTNEENTLVTNKCSLLATDKNERNKKVNISLEQQLSGIFHK